MKPLSTLSESALRKEVKKAQILSSRICDELIAAGRGYEKPSETRTKTDALSLRWLAATNQCADLQAEKSARMQWHGTMKAIRRSA